MPSTLPGRIEGIYISSVASAPMVATGGVAAIARRGLQGDRYFLETGYYSSTPGWGAQVTLIESEAIAAINTGHQTQFTAAMLRRNILTRNVKLKSLIGRKFTCGEAVFRGTKAFPPCMHLAYLLGDKKILQYLAYCGGIGAEVLSSGPVRLGDTIDLHFAQ